MSGHRLGRAIRDTVADTVVQVRQGLLRHENAAKTQQTIGMVDHMESEMAPKAASLFQPLMDHPDVPDDLKAFLREVGVPTNFTDFFAILASIVGAIFSVAPAAAAPWVNAAAQAMLSGDPNLAAPADALAQLSARGKLADGQAFSEATKTGVGPFHFGVLKAVFEHGPTTTEAFELRRRSIIGDEELHGAMRDAGYTDNASRLIRGLLHGPPSADQAVAAAIESQITMDELGTLLAQNGIDPAWRDVLYQTAGRPPGLAELLALMNRGLVTEATVRQAVAESDVKTKYSDAIVAMAVYLPPPRSIVPMMRSGSISVARGRHLLMQHGLSAEDSEAFVREATLAKTANAKHASASLILSMFADLEMDRATAERLLRNLQHDEESMVLELGHAEALRGKKLRDAAVSRIRAQYDRRHIDRQTASNLLDRAAVPSPARDQMLATWDVEREVEAPQLTVQQLGQAFKKGGIDAETLKAKFTGLGYSAFDVDALMVIYGAA